MAPFRRIPLVYNRRFRSSHIAPTPPDALQNGKECQNSNVGRVDFPDHDDYLFRA